MSWLPSIARDERVILGFFSAAAVGTVYLMHMMLKDFRDEAEIKPTQPKTQYITQETEDALKFSTLDTLLGHYNYAIRDTACKIVCDRTANDGSTLDVLLWGITRPDYDERMKNLRALAFVTDQNTLHLLHNDKAYSALVRSLELCLPSERKPEDKLNDKSYDEYYLRDMAEKLCLMFISQLLHRYEVSNRLVKAKFVEKWLAKQYWGDTPDEVITNFTQYMDVRDNRVSEIVKHIIGCRRGREALVKTGLITQSTRDIIEGQGTSARRLSYVLPIYVGTDDSDENADRPVGVRHQEHSAEEQRLRHRHREAMVFNDGTRPLNSEDIIQRDHGTPMPSQP
ncbi:hypothetical protein CONLIGDRAFT_28387 [Coniochaeta ligniaria NRRL 30616]|uniref:Cytoskeleton-associated protein n=1 Tax=Coniochaeta ligniaria NRRL 30616 TaxID=1408157 RepID=A0A1J7JXQ1_9PEZI|nr:hypothetical protein CONLIGDRAFT_28387 [Coniochaeta ligniaria NRRL 30616]